MRQLIAVAVLAALAYFAFEKFKPQPSELPPAPASIINSTRDRLTPFRFNLTTDPASPSSNSSVLLKVHVIDGADQPAEGVTLTAVVSMSGMQQNEQHVTLDDKGSGDYEGRVNLDAAGNWDVDLTATKDGKSRQQRFDMVVGG